MVFPFYYIADRFLKVNMIRVAELSKEDRLLTSTPKFSHPEIEGAPLGTLTWK